MPEPALSPGPVCAALAGGFPQAGQVPLRWLRPAAVPRPAPRPVRAQLSGRGPALGPGRGVPYLVSMAAGCRLCFGCAAGCADVQAREEAEQQDV